MQRFSLAVILARWGEAVTAQERNSSILLGPIYKPYLSNLPDSAADFNPALGGLNYDTCCALAINESVFVGNDTLFIRPGQTFFRGTIPDLELFPEFPCFQQYNGSLTGPTSDFLTPYTWCINRCPGWAVTKATNNDAWVMPMGSFILPSLAFCFNVPRRRAINLSKRFFSGTPLRFTRFLTWSIKLPIASLLVALDMLVWLAVVFTLAGPLLVSGIYEAMLDSKMLDFVDRRRGDLPIQVQFHSWPYSLAISITSRRGIGRSSSSGALITRRQQHPARRIRT